MFIVPDRTSETLQNLIKENCQRGSIMHTDGYNSYNGLDRIRNYPLVHRKFIHAEARHVRRLQRGQVRIRPANRRGTN